MLYKDKNFLIKFFSSGRVIAFGECLCFSKVFSLLWKIHHVRFQKFQNSKFLRVFITYGFSKSSECVFTFTYVLNYHDIFFLCINSVYSKLRVRIQNKNVIQNQNIFFSEKRHVLNFDTIFFLKCVFSRKSNWIAVCSLKCLKVGLK